MRLIKLCTTSDPSESMSLHPRRMEEMGLQAGKQTEIRFGIRSARVRIIPNEQLPQDQALISRDTAAGLLIPLYCRYDIRAKNGNLIIGPYASFLTAYKMSTNDQYVEKLKDYLNHYEEVGGAFLAFALEGVDKESSTIMGYLYNPEEKRWIKGKYPYPASVFIRGHVSSRKWRDYFKSVLGANAVFNDFYLDKWEMHQLLSSSKGLKKYLPETTLYRKPMDLVTFLNQFPCAYVKPIHGTMGISIMKGELAPQGLMISCRKEEKNKKYLFTSYTRAKEYMDDELERNQYIIQRGIPLITHNDCMIDFRVITVKNGKNQWEYMGMIARYGAAKSIVSNISAGGFAQKGEQALQQALGLTKQDVRELSDRIADLSLQIAGYLDSVGLHCGNMGVDIGVDRHQRLWIIEIQHYSPAHSIALDAKDRALYERILRNNMLYMKTVSGFTEEESD